MKFTQVVILEDNKGVNCLEGMLLPKEASWIIDDGGACHFKSIHRNGYVLFETAYSEVAFREINYAINAGEYIPD